VFFSVAGVAELADALDSKSNIMPGGDTAIAVLLPNYASAFGHRRVGEAIFILHGRPARNLSMACFPDNSHNQEPQRGMGPSCGSLSVRY